MAVYILFLIHKWLNLIINTLHIVHIPSKLTPSVIFMFSDLSPSTLTAQAKLSNVNFDESDLIYAIIPKGRIQFIACNFGEVFNENFVHPLVKVKKSNRGRKPKEKKRKIRRNQGNGKYFNSQITFWIKSLDRVDKVYKVKLFRNGTAEIPGGLDPSMGDVYDALIVVASAIKDCLMTDVGIIELRSVMRNYKFSLVNEDVRVNIPELHKVFVREHKKYSKNFPSISEVKFNPERYPGLIVKFSTPTQKNRDKHTTIKMFRSGKVNIDGVMSESSAYKFYNWLTKFYVENISSIIYEPPKVFSDISSSESDED